MSKKVYISPSDQTENRYAWGNTNEHVQCQKIAEAEAAALRRSGVEVQVAALGSTMAQRCAQSDAFKADIHNCVHTNAFNGKVTGSKTLDIHQTKCKRHFTATFKQHLF